MPKTTALGARPEIVPLTSLRGAACLFVVLHHFVVQFGEAFHPLAYTRLFDRSYLWVDFFFVLSGFVIGHVYTPAFPTVERTGYVAFMLRRLGRVYPLHVFMLLLFLPTELAKLLVRSGADAAFSHNTPLSIVSNLTLTQAWNLFPEPTWNWPSWSISAEFAAYLVFPFVARPFARLGPRGLVAMVAVAVATLAALEAGPGHGTLDLTAHGGVARCLPSFAIGMAIARWHGMARGPIARAIASDLVLAGALGAAFILMHVGVNDLAVVLAFAVVVAGASRNRGKVGVALSWRPLHVLGVLSYSIYMTHGLFRRLWQFVFDRFFHGHIATTGALAALLICLVFVVGFSWLTWRFVERPGRRLFNAWAEKWANRLPPPSEAGLTDPVLVGGPRAVSGSR